MRGPIKKLVLTAQSSSKMFKLAQERTVTACRRVLRRPHDRDFAALKLFNADAPGVYVDGGANDGQSIASIKLFRPDAYIVAFEPNPSLARNVERRYAHDPRVEVHAVGLNDTEGEMTLFVPYYRGVEFNPIASLDRDEALGWLNADRVFFFDPSKLTDRQFTCPVSTIDKQELDAAFIKLDVEGREYEVLKGALNTLSRCEPIVMTENFHGDPRAEPMMSDLGFQEYYYDGGNLVRGRAPSANAFLITDGRAKAEGL